MTLTLHTHITLLTQIVLCIDQLSGTQAGKGSEESTVFTFSYRKAYVSKFDLAVK